MTTRGGFLGCAALALVLGCGASGDDDDGTDPTGEPLVWQHRFPDIALGAGEEIDDLCASWTLGNERPIYVNEVAMTAGFGWHHSNWYFVPDDRFEGEDGVWRCEDRNFDQLAAAVAGGVLFAQSTQATDESQKFKPGAALVLPPRARVVGQLHLLNAGTEGYSTSIELNLHALPEDQVTVRMAPLSLEFLPLRIPPGSRSVFRSTCDFQRAHQDSVGRALDFDVHYVLPHYHNLGEGMTIEATGGPEGDALIFQSDSPIGEPMGGLVDPAFDLTGYQGMRFSCTFNNPTDKEVRWGIGDQEMCIFLAFTDSEMKWGGGVLTGEPTYLGEENGLHVYEADCSLVAFPFLE